MLVKMNENRILSNVKINLKYTKKKKTENKNVQFIFS